MRAWGSILLGLATRALGLFSLPLGFLGPFMPYVLGCGVVLGILGFVYHKGRVHERLEQARVIAAVNKKIDTWRRDLGAEDKAEEDRVAAAVLKAQESFAKSPPAKMCKLTPDQDKSIQAILGSIQ